MKRFAIMILVFTFGLTFIAVGGEKEEVAEKEVDRGTCYYLAPVLFDEYQAGSKLLIEQYGREKGFDTKTLNANNQAIFQNDQMDDVIAQNPSVIIVQAVDSQTILGSIKKARDKGIPVIAYGRVISDTYIDFSSMLSEIKIGEMAAAECVKLLKDKHKSEKGVILEIMGDMGDNYTVLIDKGFQDAISKYRNIEVIAKDTHLWEPTVSANIVDDQLSARSDIDIIFVHADFRGSSIVPVLESHGYTKGEIMMVGTDGMPTGLDLIREGWMTATVSIPTVQNAYGCFLFIDDILAEKKINPGNYTVMGIEAEVAIDDWGPTLYLPGEWITKENVDNPDLWGNLEVEIEE